MLKQPTTKHIIAPRPTQAGFLDVQIPADWLIFNAPRPMLGSQLGPDHLSWVGDFQHGIFYAAVDPEDKQAMEVNTRLDGWILHYVTEAEVEAWGRQYCEDQFINYEDFEWIDVMYAYLDNHNNLED